MEDDNIIIPIDVHRARTVHVLFFGGGVCASFAVVGGHHRHRKNERSRQADDILDHLQREAILSGGIVRDGHAKTCDVPSCEYLLLSSPPLRCSSLGPTNLPPFFSICGEMRQGAPPPPKYVTTVILR
jgi:hypothetical protein